MALDELLRDAVANGASVGYVAVPTSEECRDYWRGVESALAAGTLTLLVARAGDRLLGTVHLATDPRPNSRHRAEVKRLLVHSSARNRGIGRALMLAAEHAARAAGRRLLLLDVRPGDPAERLYRVLGWQAAGSVPDYILEADGRLTPTLFMYRQLT